MRTSIYLSNHSLQIAVGDTKGKKVVLERLLRLEIQEGDLINGVITNQDGLKNQLEEIWDKYTIPRKNVEIIVDSTQIATKVVTIPKLNDKKTRELIQKEFSNIQQPDQYLFDYRIMERDNKTKSVRILCAAAAKELVQSYIDLFSSMGINVDCVDISLNGILKALALHGEHQTGTYITSILDGDNLVNLLILDGEYKLFERNRIFNEHHTREFAIEVSRNISSLLQFVSTQSKDVEVKRLYIGGFDTQDATLCKESIESLGLELEKGSDVTSFSMPGSAQMIHDSQLDEYSGNFYHYIFSIGNMISYKKDMNFAAQLANSSTSEKKGSKDNLEVKIVAGVLGACVLVTAGLFVWNMILQNRLNDADTYLSNQGNSAKYQEAVKIDKEITKKQEQVKQLDSVKNVLDSYPQPGSNVENQMKSSAGGNVTVKVNSYAAETGSYEFTASASNVRTIYDFINRLEKTKMFAKLSYSGYNYTETTKKYDLKVSGFLSEEAGK